MRRGSSVPVPPPGVNGNKSLKNALNVNSYTGMKIDGDGKENGKNMLPLLQQDIEIIKQKIQELSGERGSGSPFVSGIRNATGNAVSSSSSCSAKSAVQPTVLLTAYDELIQKLNEHDKLVLRKTAPETTTAARRKSRGMDLTTFPAHLNVSDRLVDLYTQSQRVTVITKNNDSDQNASTEISEYKREIESLKSDLHKASMALSASTSNHEKIVD